MLTFLTRVGKVLRLLSLPGGARAVATWRPFSLAAYAIVGELRAYGINPAVVIDIGANEGQFSRAVIQTFPETRIHAFEPLGKAYARLVDNLKDENRTVFRRCALGSETGVVTLHVNSFSQSSSVLLLGKGHLEAFPKAREIGQETTDVVRLDDALEDIVLDESSLLKIDVQGYELEVLKGAPNVLANVKHVLVEVGLMQLYVGEPSFSDILHFLEGAGFRFVAPISILRDDKKGVALQMDALFVRDN